MYQYEKITVDAAEVQSKLEGTTLKMKTISKKMMTAANREVIKEAKKNVKSVVNTDNHSYIGDDKTITLPLLKSFKAKNSNKENFASFVRSNNFHSAFIEKGAEIHAKNGKYLTFKVSGHFVKVQSVSIPARPFLEPAVKDVWESGKAKTIMENVLEKELKKYWDKHVGGKANA